MTVRTGENTSRSSTAIGDDVEEQVKRFVVDVLRVRDLQPEQIVSSAPLFDGFTLDSLDEIQLAVALRRRFGVTFGDDRAAHDALHSIATIAAHLRAHGIVLGEQD